METINSVPFGRTLCQARHFLARDLKRFGFDKLLQQTATNVKVSLELDRQMSIACQQLKMCDSNGTMTLFSQASMSVDPGFAALRSSGEQPFKVSHLGEAGVDAGGVYRDFFES